MDRLLLGVCWIGGIGGRYGDGKVCHSGTVNVNAIQCLLNVFIEG